MSRPTAPVLLLLLLTAGCGHATETIVVIDADPAVRSSLASVRVRACGDGTGTVVDQTVSVRAGAPDAATFPLRVPLYPNGEDATRTFALLVEGADGDTSVVLEARIIGGFQRGRRLELALGLEGSCLGHAGCPADQTCRAGSCEPAAVAPFERASASCDFAPTCSAGGCEGGVVDAAVDAGVEAGVCAAGACTAGVDASAPCPWGCGADGCCDAPARIDVGSHDTCALTRLGALWCWGANELGQTGVSGAGAVVPRPARVAGVQARDLSLGATHTCVLTTDGAAMCWGDSSEYKLGPAARPGRYDPASAEVVDVAAAISSTCVALSDGTAQCWGRGDEGQLGDGVTQSLVPSRSALAVTVRIAGAPLGSIVAVAAGFTHVCALDSAGAVYCWGSNNAGQLGDGTTTGRAEAVRVALGSPAREVRAGWQLACARMMDGTVACWGDNGGLVLGSEGPSSATPVLVPGVSRITHLDAFHHVLARTEDATVVAWGANWAGQLGRGSVGASQLPGDVLTLAGVVDVAAGGEHSCATGAAGQAWCWGTNASSALGVDLDAGTSSPIGVAP